MRPEILTLISTLSGAIIGSLSTLAVTWLGKLYEDRRYRRELVITTALENWKQACEFAFRSKGSTLVPPLDDFIIHMLVLSERLIDKKIDVAEIHKIMKEVDQIVDQIIEFRKAQKSREHSA